MTLRSIVPVGGLIILLLDGCSDDTLSPQVTLGAAGASAGVAGQSAVSAGSGGTGAVPAAGGMTSAAGGASGGTLGGNASGGGTTPGAGAGAGGSDPGGVAGTSAGGADASGGQPALGVDVFGITMLKASKPGDEWNSLHWSEGELRSVTGRDPSDPTGWSIQRGDTAMMEIDGAGVLSMGGAQPRFYVQPENGQTVPFFRDIEFTGYYRRTAADGASNSGFAVGVRAHVNGHGDVDHCLASTYYLIFRNSGTWIFDKELDHPADSPGEGGTLLSGGGAIPVGKWIGMKFLAYNLPGDTSVKLEAYIDEDTDGDVSQGGSWVKLGETVDDGNWSAPTGDCGIPENTVVTEGGGVVFIRNTSVAKVQYTKVSWREIVDAPAAPSPAP